MSSINPSQQCVIEVSWEVCNFVGGIYTVLSTKAKEATRQLGDYICIGPLLEKNTAFVATTSDPSWSHLKPLLDLKGVAYQLGYWDIEGHPKVILIDPVKKMDSSKVLYHLWEAYGIDFYNDAEWDVIEPVLFSTYAAMIIQDITKLSHYNQYDKVAHFHEWITGAGILYLKQYGHHIGCVFTTHATVLGRSLVSQTKNATLAHSEDSEEMAKQSGVYLKHTIEKLSIEYADVATTVSDITKGECERFFNRKMDAVIHNGLNVTDHYPYLEKKQALKSTVLAQLSSFLNRPLSDQTQIWVTSGRYEFYNKGYDFLCDLANQLNQELALPADAPIIIIFAIAVESLGPISQQDNHEWNHCLTHHISTVHHDPILTHIQSLSLHNTTEDSVLMVYSPAILDGNDGIYNMPYTSVLAAADLGIFLSLYEPWGYTPQEGLALGTPVLTTNCSGFSLWFNTIELSQGMIINRQNENEASFKAAVAQLKNVYESRHLQTPEMHLALHHVSMKLDWQVLFPDYLKCYQQSIDSMTQLEHNYNTILQSGDRQKNKTELFIKKFKSHPRLIDMIQNFWWSSSKELPLLFQSIDSALWQAVTQNPIRFLTVIPIDYFEQRLSDPQIQTQYQYVERAYQNRLDAAQGADENPIVYLSMEYGLHECLPIYSGGLGVLSGDHFKAVSNLGINVVGMGVLYKSGYFKQVILENGQQVERSQSYELNDLPLYSDESQIFSMYLEDKIIFVKYWTLTIAANTLYLMDTDIIENPPEIRQITQQLYVTDRDTRLRQELILGIGAYKLIQAKGITPKHYHLNEGHSAFILMERLREMTAEYSVEQAIAKVQKSTLFTTHTSVPAGNEVFSRELIQQYLYRYIDQSSLNWDVFLKLGMVDDKTFSMTYFSLNLSGAVNSVSKLHQSVTSSLWKDKVNRPIAYVTNGVHSETWCGPEIQSLLIKTGSISEPVNVIDINSDHFERTVSTAEIWDAHKRQKTTLIHYLIDRLKHQYLKRGESQRFIGDIVKQLSHKSMLTIGFARRCATYKRSSLMFINKKRLKNLLTNTKHPVRIIIAGKAHPEDGMGKTLITEIMAMSREMQFKGHIMFLENYDMATAKTLVQGVDLWLNTPEFGKEACGTSGMKAGLNGVLNCSIADGWYYEVHPDTFGFCIPHVDSDIDVKSREAIESMNLLDLLEKTIVPMYYAQYEGTSNEWASKMKVALHTMLTTFNANRMVKQYYQENLLNESTYAVPSISASYMH